MPRFTRSTGKNIRLTLMATLHMVALFSAAITVAGLNITYNDVLGLQEREKWTERITTSSKLRRSFFLWTGYIFHLVFLCMDLLIYDQLFYKPICRKVRIMAICVNMLRVIFSLLELYILSPNFTTKVIDNFGVLGIAWILKLLALSLEIILLVQILFMKFEPRFLESASVVQSETEV